MTEEAGTWGRPVFWLADESCVATDVELSTKLRAPAGNGDRTVGIYLPMGQGARPSEVEMRQALVRRGRQLWEALHQLPALTRLAERESVAGLWLSAVSLEPDASLQLWFDAEPDQVVLTIRKDGTHAVMSTT